MPICQIDHLVVTAPSLEAGAAYLRKILNVELAAGGKHPVMGTHNLLAKLGDGLYLEVIAPDPDAPAPSRPRWFGLDEPGHHEEPRLAAWVARTDDIDAATAASPVPLGCIKQMERGKFNWRITIPADGIPPLDGAAPALIQWQTPGHPAAGLSDQGLSLVELTIIHPAPERVSHLLHALGMTGPLRVEAAGPGTGVRLNADIKTDTGLRTL